MEWTEEQQTEINKLVDTAKAEAIKGLFTQEQLNTEIGKAKEGLFDNEALTTKIQEETNKLKLDYDKQIETLNAELGKYKPKDKTETEKLLEQKEAELNAYKVKEKLTENKLPSGLYKFISGEGEGLDNNIKELSEIINDIIIDGSFKGGQHKKQTTGLTKEQFEKMDYFEKMKVYEENPTLWEQFTNK